MATCAGLVQRPGLCASAGARRFRGPLGAPPGSGAAGTSLRRLSAHRRPDTTSPGARLRYQLDRESQAYKDVYKQRTATERTLAPAHTARCSAGVNSQAVELGTLAPAQTAGAVQGVERPRLRNGQAVAHLNTLIYILINLRALQRIRQRKATGGSALPEKA